MPLDGPVFDQRARAESFGAVAANYDRYRPSYPAALIDDLAELRPHRTLDIGCGTGKAARLLAARGLPVLGVEVDPKMAAVARSHGLDVEVGTFEGWDDRGRSFDLITSAQAWHWVDPVAGAAKAARLLEPGGTLALFWNYDELDTDVRSVVDGVYGQLAPELLGSVVTGAHRHSNKPYVEDLERSALFGPITTRRYRWTKTSSLEDWLGMVGTHSDHLMLGATRLAALTSALRTALTAAGTGVRVSGGTYLILARVPR